MFFLFAAIFGLGHGSLQAMFSPMVAELFGLGSHGTILGIASFTGVIGAAIGPVLAGYIFDVTGSYQVAFLVSAAIGVVGLILSTTLRPIKGVTVEMELSQS